MKEKASISLMNRFCESLGEEMGGGEGEVDGVWPLPTMPPQHPGA